MTIPAPLKDTHPRMYTWAKKLQETLDDPNNFPKYREFLPEEKSRIWTLIKSGKVFLIPWDEFGFRMGITLYCFPNKNGEKPEELLRIHQNQLGIKKEGFNEETPDPQSAWALLSPFSHSPENKSVVNFFGLGPVHEKRRFAY